MGNESPSRAMAPDSELSACRTGDLSCREATFHSARPIAAEQQSVFGPGHGLGVSSRGELAGADIEIHADQRTLLERKNKATRRASSEEVKAMPYTALLVGEGLCLIRISGPITRRNGAVWPGFATAEKSMPPVPPLHGRGVLSLTPPPIWKR
jgi:hypothetical protein